MNYESQSKASKHIIWKAANWALMASREWWFLQSWKWQCMDPCLKQASCLQSSPFLLSQCLGQHGWMPHGWQHPVQSQKGRKNEQHCFTWQENTINYTLKFMQSGCKWVKYISMEQIEKLSFISFIPIRKCWCQLFHVCQWDGAHCLHHKQQCAPCASVQASQLLSW